MERSFRKQIGRFLKKGDKILNVVALKGFSFEEICEHPIVQCDNPTGNLILARFHEVEELKTSVQKHKGLEREIRDADNIPPILQPLDFTHDWRRAQERASRRIRGRIDEDEDYELEMEMSRTQGEKRADVPAESSPTPASVPYENAPEATNSTPTPVPNIPTAVELSETQKNMESFKAPKKNLDSVGDAIRQINTSETEEASVTPKISPAPNADLGDGFIRVTPSAAAPATPSAKPVELDAMREYRDILGDPDLQPKNLRSAVDQAKSTGYQDGFRQGEEKATIQLKQTTERVVNSVSGLLDELAALRKQILTAAEQNFYEVCQALAESLFERELRVNPEMFGKLIEKAVADSLPDEQFKVHVHPEFHKQLTNLDLKSLSGRLVQDPLVAPGDFKIESNLSVIDGKLKQTITELLQNADLSLFEKKDKAS